MNGRTRAAGTAAMALWLLAGCGGGGAPGAVSPDPGGVGGGGGAGPDPVADGYDAALASFGTLDADRASMGMTEPGALPDHGQSSYRGIATMALETGPMTAFAGDLEMTVAFADSGSVEGSVFNIVDDADRAYSGELGIALGSGALDRGAAGGPQDPTITGAHVLGTVGAPGGGSALVEGLLSGDFAGEAWGTAGGTWSGAMCPTMETCATFAGEWAAARY